MDKNILRRQEVLMLTDKILELTVELERTPVHWDRDVIQAEIDEAKRRMVDLDREARGDMARKNWRNKGSKSE